MSARFRVEVARPTTIATEQADLITVLTGIDGGKRIEPSSDGALEKLGASLGHGFWLLLINTTTEVATLVNPAAVNRIEIMR